MSKCHHVWTYYVRSRDGVECRSCRRCHQYQWFDDWFFFGIFGEWKDV